jgi:hypothetical protein
MPGMDNVIDSPADITVNEVERLNAKLERAKAGILYPNRVLGEHKA